MNMHKYQYWVEVLVLQIMIGLANFHSMDNIRSGLLRQANWALYSQQQRVHVTAGANVSFINNTSSWTYCAGAMHLTCTMVHIITNATLLLLGNSVTHPYGEGGAISITYSHLIISGAMLHMNNNRANHGGAILLRFATVSISNFALVSCRHHENRQISTSRHLSSS